MKIAMILPDLSGGGVERMRLVLATEFLKRGHDVHLILLYERGALMSQVPRGCTVHILGIERLRQAMGPLVSQLRALGPDVALCAMWPLSLVGVIAGRRAGCPAVVFSEHTTFATEMPHYYQRAAFGVAMSACLRLADQAIAITQAVAEDIESLPTVPKGRFEVVANPAQLSADTASHPAPTTERRRILAVGNLKPEKDHATLVRGVASGFTEEDVELVILGEGPLRQNLEDLAAVLNVALVMPGFIMSPAEWYRSADLFVLSSYREGLGNVLIEAMSFGVPVVSTDLPGPREVVGDLGAYFPVGDHERLGKVMRTALEGAPRRQALIERSRLYTPERIANQYLNAFTRCLDRKRT